MARLRLLALWVLAAGAHVSAQELECSTNEECLHRSSGRKLCTVAEAGLREEHRRGKCVSKVECPRGEGWYWFDTAPSGISACCPEPVCGPVKCARTPNFEKNEKGCPKYPCGISTCCRKPVCEPPSGCNGEPDENGCPTCVSCVSRVGCPMVKCARRPGCTYTASNEKDANGCLMYPCGVEYCPCRGKQNGSPCDPCDLSEDIMQCPRALRALQNNRASKVCDGGECKVGGGGPGGTTCPEGCTSWFDGCNICRCKKDGTTAGCTKKFCPGAKKPGKCRAYDCNTEEVWSDAKKAWCDVHLPCQDKTEGETCSTCEGKQDCVEPTNKCTSGGKCCPETGCKKPPPGCTVTKNGEPDENGCPTCGKPYCPCKDKDDGCPCSLCDPNDETPCIETAVVKACRNGMCEMGIPLCCDRNERGKCSKFCDKEKNVLQCAMPPVVCPVCDQPKPPAGCTYTPSDEMNEKGCPKYPCGKLYCLKKASDASKVGEVEYYDWAAGEAKTKKIIVDGIEREYLVYLPADAPDKVPLMISYHGFGGDGPSYMQYTDFRPVADEAKFLVVYPTAHLQGKDGSYNRFWSNGDQSYVDDVKFTEMMIAELVKDYGVDEQKIYASGFSNGGVQTFVLACALSTRFAAAAVIGANMPNSMLDTCTPTERTGMLTILGDLDDIFTYDGNEYYSSAEATFRFWIDKNDAGGGGNPEVFKRDVDHYQWQSGGDSSCYSVEHYKFIGGHVVPDWATTEIWKFVSQYTSEGMMDCESGSSADVIERDEKEAGPIERDEKEAGPIERDEKEAGPRGRGSTRCTGLFCKTGPGFRNMLLAMTTGIVVLTLLITVTVKALQEEPEPTLWEELKCTVSELIKTDCHNGKIRFGGRRAESGTMTISADDSAEAYQVIQTLSATSGATVTTMLVSRLQAANYTGAMPTMITTVVTSVTDGGSSSSSGSDNTMIMIAAVVAAVCLLLALLVIGALVYLWKRNKQPAQPSDELATPHQITMGSVGVAVNPMHKPQE